MPQGTDAQERLLATLRGRERDLEVTWAPGESRVTHLSGALAPEQSGDPVQIARAFLAENRALFGIEDIQQELGRSSVKTDAYGWHHVAFQQEVGGVPVWSGSTQVHMSGAGAIRSVSSALKAHAGVNLQPTVNAAAATRSAAEAVGAEQGARPMQDPYLTVYVYEGTPHLAWVLTLRGWSKGFDETIREPASWRCFVDAHDGTLIARFNRVHTHVVPTGEGESVNNPPLLVQSTKTFVVSHTHGPDRYRLQDSTRHIDVYDADGAVPSGSGAITGNLSEDTNNDWDTTTGWNSTDHTQRVLCQSAEVDALDHLARTRDYYSAKFGRNSIDNAGLTIKAYTHVQTVDDFGNTIAYNNAYWDGDNNHIAFGDGEYDGIGGNYGDQTFFSGALDIVVHEYTHGVTHFEIRDPAGNPAGFTYWGESGAANEAFSDIFAAFVDGDWRQGDKIVVGALNAGGRMWRDLGDPTRGLAYDPNDTIAQMLAKGVPQPDHYDLRYQGSDDNGGVHINSSIISYACYLATHGGVSHHAGRIPEAVRVYRKDRLGIGQEHAEQIFYLALTSYFNGTPGTGDNTDVTFAEVRQAVLDACNQLRLDHQHGIDLCDWRTLKTAFYAVGLQPAGQPYGPDPMITPWGIWTGTGPSYQSPDVWCQDAGGTHVNAEKNMVNTLVAQVHNIGDQPANGVTVRFFYSPFGFGYHHEDFKSIGDQVVNFAAGETKSVSVNWDLTNLAEDFGGVWPRPISDFDHFCVRVEIVAGAENDVNDCNNMVQHNFVNVGTHQGAVLSTTLIMANPDREMTTKMELVLETTLPRGWKVQLDGKPIPSNVTLKGHEKRVAKLSVSVPVQPLIRPPIEGTLSARLGGRIRGTIEGQLGEVTYTAASRKFRGSFHGALSGRRRARLRAVIEGQILNQDTGELEGSLRGMAFDDRSGEPFELEGEILGRLRPERRVSLGSRINGEPVGGVDFSLTVI